MCHKSVRVLLLPLGSIGACGNYYPARGRDERDSVAALPPLDTQPKHETRRARSREPRDELASAVELLFAMRCLPLNSEASLEFEPAHRPNLCTDGTVVS